MIKSPLDKLPPSLANVRINILCGFVFLLFSSVWIFFIQEHLKSLEKENLEKDEATFSNVLIVLNEKIESFIHGMQGLGGVVHSAHNVPTPIQIQNYAEFREDFKNFPGALGFGFIRIVPREKLSSYEIAQKKLRPGFFVKQLNPHLHDHFVIEYIEPLEKNRKALGLDIASESRRYEAAMEALKSGKPKLTKPIFLVQREEKVGGFLFLLPIYNTPAVPRTEQERLKQAIGWVYTPLLAEDLQHHLRDVLHENISLEISDVTNSSEILPILQESKISNSETFQFSKEIEVGGRIWKVRAKSIAIGSISRIKTAAVFFGLSGVLVLAVAVVFLRAVLVRLTTSSKYLNSLEAWNHAIIDRANYGMVATNELGVIQVFNKEAERLFGYQPAEVVGIKTPAIFHDHDEVVLRNKQLREETGLDIPMGFATFVHKANTTGKPDVTEWNFIRKDQSRFPARLTVISIVDNSGLIHGYLGIVEDLTEIKRLEHVISLQQSNLANSAKMSALGEMAGGIAHEINNPLAIISSRCEMLVGLIDENTTIDQIKLKQDLQKVIHTTSRIAKIIKGLRSFARDSSQDRPELTQIGRVIADTIDLCKEKFSNHNVALVFEGDMAQIVSCRSVQISQVLMNLLVNAFDAVQGCDVKRVVIRVVKEEGRVNIQVIDSGNGIPKEVASRILEPFFTTKEVGKGTGLGLSISKGIVESHGGELSFSSEPGRTIFNIRLPLKSEV